MNVYRICQRLNNIKEKGGIFFVSITKFCGKFGFNLQKIVKVADNTHILSFRTCFIFNIKYAINFKLRLCWSKIYLTLIRKKLLSICISFTKTLLICFLILLYYLLFTISMQLLKHPMHNNFRVKNLCEKYISNI